MKIPVENSGRGVGFSRVEACKSRHRYRLRWAPYSHSCAVMGLRSFCLSRKTIVHPPDPSGSESGSVSVFAFAAMGQIAIDDSESEFDRASLLLRRRRNILHRHRRRRGFRLFHLVGGGGYPGDLSGRGVHVHEVLLGHHLEHVTHEIDPDG